MASGSRAKSAKTRFRFPFPFVGQGIAYGRKVMSVLVAFDAPVAKTALTALVPAPFDEVTWLSSRLLVFAHTSFLERAVKSQYGRKGFAGLATDVEQALRAMHAASPILLAFRPVDEEGDTELGPWHAWSSLEAVPARWKETRAALATAKDNDEDASWESALHAQLSADLAALPARKRAKVAASFARAGIEQRASGPDRPPTDLDGKLALWSSLRGTGPNRPHQYWMATGSGENLLDVFTQLGKVGRWGEAADIGIDVLDASATSMDREFWVKRTVLALVRAKRVDEARRRLPLAMKQRLPYEPTFAWIEMLALAARKDDAALVLAHAVEKLQYFALTARQHAAELGGLPKVRRDAKRYATLFREWCT